MKIFTWNINDDRRVQLGGFANKTHEKWSIQNRLPEIIDFLTTKYSGMDIYCLQEMSRSTCAKIKKEMEENGYKCIEGQYSSDEEAYMLLTILNTNVKYLSHKITYYNKNMKTPTFTSEQYKCYKSLEKTDKKKFEEMKAKLLVENLGRDFETSCLSVDIKYNDLQFTIHNTHLGTQKEQKMKACHLLVNDIDKNSRQSIIICGDFNTFVEDYDEQMNIFKGYNDLTESIETTFHFYPYDFACGGKEKDEMKLLKENELIEYINKKNMQRKSPFGGHLDHIFSIEPVKFKTTCPEYNTIKNNTDKLLQGPIIPSDHLPLICEIIFIETVSDFDE